ncbi:MAG: YraN family protein [Deltaproteobacteria bacterium]|nr:YraN family protein [Deltaproteobacteria bacterium]
MAEGVLSKRLALGQRAESLAARHLEDLGFAILARNWRRPEGELDLVVTKEGLCVFVEVRSRTGSERGHPLETVDARKRARVRRAARLFIDEERPTAAVFRFDVVGVTFALDDSPPEMVHVEDAFAAD